MKTRTLSVLRMLTTLATVIPFAPQLAAQNQATPAPPATPSTGKGQIVGIVVDSLDAKYLSGADVVIRGGEPAAHTDSLGKFSIDSLVPGTYQVGVFHDLLDTLDVTLLTRPFRVGPDSAVVVILAIPSAATLAHRSCPGSGGAAASAVVGHVSDPETFRPVAGAEVSMAWTEFEISKELGLRRTPRLIRDTTDAAGAFTICGLPNSMQATLQARHGAAVSGEIPITLGDRPVEFKSRTILLSSADSTAKSGGASVSGRVFLEGGSPSAGSRVELVGSDAVVMTDEKGEFTMRNLPSGSRVLLARHLGYGAETVPVDLSSHKEPRVTITLPKFVAVMDPVLVTARRVAALDKVGFNDRRKSGLGYYIGPDRLARMHAIEVTDILRMVPGLRVSYGPNGEMVSSSRGIGGSCVQYYLDDMHFTELEPGDINRFVTGGEVVAVEVYQGPGTPPQFTLGGGGCTTIVLWTRFKIRS
jgi:hypothetical protein